jgi:hypothetical protein
MGYITSQGFPAAQGDITLAWTEDQVDMMTEIIGRKMAEGFSFFFVDDEKREVRLRNISDLKGRNAVVIGDKEAEQLIRQGKIGIVDVSDMVEDQVSTRGRAKTPREAATRDTVAIAPKGPG